MKTMGLIGGMSWESTLEYYRIINETVRLRLGGLHSAPCLLHSLDFAQIEAHQHRGEWDRLADILVASAKALRQAGADFIVICTNTMHVMAPAIEQRAGIEVVHIAVAAGEAIAARNLKKVGLLGTRFTMEGSFYREILTRQFGIDVLVPDEADRAAIHAVIYDELCQGIVKDSSRSQYQSVINRLAERGAEGVVLGCTEIPLLIRPEDASIPIFDTTALHAVAAVDRALAG